MVNGTLGKYSAPQGPPATAVAEPSRTAPVSIAAAPRLVRSRSISANPDDHRLGGNAVRVDEEEHVVTGRREVRGGWSLDGQASGAGLERDGDEALVLIERMGHRPQSDQRDRGGPPAVWSAHEERSGRGKDVAYILRSLKYDI